MAEGLVRSLRAETASAGTAGRLGVVRRWRLPDLLRARRRCTAKASAILYGRTHAAADYFLLPGNADLAVGVDRVPDPRNHRHRPYCRDISPSGAAVRGACRQSGIA